MKKAWQPHTVLVFLILALLAPVGVSVAQSNGTEARISIPNPENDELKRKWNGDWRLGMGAFNFSEGKDDGTGGLMRLTGSFRYNLAPFLHFYFQPQIRFYSARVQSRYDEDLADSGIRIRNGYVGIGKEETLGVKVGVLDQEPLRSDLLVSGRRAFPGVRETFHFGTRAVRVTGTAQQTVPTSYSLNTRRVEREPTPTFLTETLEFKITPAKEFEAEIYATHFRFNHLPAVVAFDSALLGNSVMGESAAGSAFRYGFDGFLVGTEVAVFQVGPMDFRVGGQWLQNTSAPKELNRGQLLFLQSTLRVNSDLEITPRFSSYFAESDVAPAAYNTWDMGNNNRKGLMAELRVRFPNYGFNVDAKYVQAETINDYAFQADKQYFFIGVEMDNVPF